MIEPRTVYRDNSSTIPRKLYHKIDGTNYVKITSSQRSATFSKLARLDHKDLWSILYIKDYFIFS